MEQRYDDEIEIDLMEIFMVLLHYIWVMAIAAVIVGGAAFIFSKFVVTPTYESTTRILVLNRQDTAGGSLTYSDLQLGTSLTKDYPELIQSRYVVEKVVENFGLNTTYEAFIKKIQVSTKSDSRIIDITITDEDSVMAKEIADALRDIAAERIVEVTDMYKFRSMYPDAEKRKQELLAKNRVDGNLMFKLEEDPRIVGSRFDEMGNYHKGIGNWIRETSLDEFPQFFNVLKGDMSLVGTRPPTVEEYERYELHHRARLAAKPGITGLWQISGRSNITDFEEVVKLDMEYIQDWSFARDLKILFKTVQIVLRGEGSM